MTLIRLMEDDNNPHIKRKHMVLSMVPRGQGPQNLSSPASVRYKKLNMRLRKASSLSYDVEGKFEESGYYKEKKGERSHEPTPVDGVGSSQQEVLQTLMELKRKVEGEISASTGESLFIKKLEDER